MKKNKIRIFICSLLIIGALLIFVNSCKKEEKAQIPEVVTSLVTNITSTTAIGGGYLINDGGSTITAKGVCWSNNQNPTIANSKTIDGTGKDLFISSITGLATSTTYYVRAYATNTAGTGYGSQETIITSAALSTLTTNELSDITSTSVKSGGNITNDGGAPILARGVCWSTTNNPTITSSKTLNGIGSGSFISLITELIPGKTYNFRAYATNSMGTAYGNLVNTTTPATLPEISTTKISDITSTTLKSGGQIINDGGSEITVCGVCWSTAHNPTISDSKTVNHQVYDYTFNRYVFKSSLTDLTLKANTTYYLRAYATNSAGTGYGAELTFTIYLNYPGSTVNDVDGNIYHTVRIGDQWWMAENLKTTKYRDGTNISNFKANSDWGNMFEPGYCWYNNDEKGYKDINGAIYNYWVNWNANFVCPEGWHVPSDAEWATLITYLGGEGVAGGKLKQAGTEQWLSPNYEATNESGFTAIPGGFRLLNGAFSGYGSTGRFWSSTKSEEFPIYNNWSRSLSYGYDDVFRDNSDMSYGMSIRCIKD